MDEKAYLIELDRIWKRNWPAGIPREIEYSLGKVPIFHYLKHHAHQTPGKPCIIFYGRSITYAEIDDLSDRFAAYLSKSGLKKGDRVAVFLLNCPQFFIVFYGILKLGCIFVPVNPLFKEHEFVHEMNDADPKIIVSLDILYPLVKSTRNKTRFEGVITTRLSDFLPNDPELPLPDVFDIPPQACPGADDFMTILEHQSPDYPDNGVSIADIAAINYTGGTTGLPKGCVHTHWNMLCTGAAGGINLYREKAETGRETAIAVLPSFWIAGELLVIIPIIKGTTIVYLTRWDAKAALMAIDRYKADTISGTTDMIVELMEHPDLSNYDIRSLKFTLVSSFVKKLNIDYRRKWEKLTGSIMRESSYGMTETHTLDTFTNGMQEGDMDLKSRPVFVGMPMPGTRFKIIDFKTGKPVPLGQEGEIVISTPTLMTSYWRNPELTKEQIRNGWYRTGDIGMLDEEGYLHYFGRNKEMIKVKGMSVFPSEIEIILGRHPAVEGSGVIPKVHPDKGEIPVAFVKLKEDPAGSIDAEGLTAWARENMAVYKVPEIIILDRLPLSSTGKVLKEELKTKL
ncbi:MAG: AMP-binding protein [Desulfobacterales bacterium]